MATIKMVPRNQAPVYYAPAYNITKDASYWDELLAFGLACIAAAIVGKLVWASLYP